MPILEIATVIDVIVSISVENAWEKSKRTESVARVLRKLGLKNEPPEADFETIYIFTLIEYGVNKPRELLEFFRHAFIREAFQQSFVKSDLSILDAEAESVIEWSSFGKSLRDMDIDPRREFARFTAVFNQIVDSLRTPFEARQEQKADLIMSEIHKSTAMILERVERIDRIDNIRTEITRSTASGSARHLQHQVRSWFNTINYKIERELAQNDSFFEWVVNVPARRGYDRILIRGVSGEAKLSDAVALRLRAIEQKAIEGWLISARRISQSARQESEKTADGVKLFCYTFDELIDQNADFTSYMRWLEDEVIRRGIDKSYVPLACVKKEYDTVSGKETEVSYYNSSNGWIEGYFDRWLADPTREHLSVLGEFGTGKTWCALHYAWMCLLQYKDAKDRGIERPRLPLYIPLRDYAKSVTLESLFSEFFFRKHEIPISGYSVFEQLNRMGKFVLIFDGFDEMAARIDRQKMINNFWEIAKVVTPETKLILTCRSEHFPEAKEGRALLSAEIKASVSHLSGETPQFEVLELLPLSQEQIRQILSIRTTVSVINQIFDNRELKDMARRPVMLDLILEALPEIEANHSVNMSTVYLYAIQRKIERDVKDERTFTSLADKFYFLCELSWEMLTNEQMSINYREFPDRIRRLFGPRVTEEKDLDHWQYDMMGQTILVRSADGDYAPAHRSFLEFFSAYKLAAEIGCLKDDFLYVVRSQANIDVALSPQQYTWSAYFQREPASQHDSALQAPLASFSMEPLALLADTFGRTILGHTDKAILQLMTGMIDIQGLWHTAVSTRGHDFEEVRYTGGNAITLLSMLDVSFVKGEFSHTVLAGSYFGRTKERGMRPVNFSGINLQGSDLRNSQLYIGNMQGADLRHCQFTDSHISHVWDMDKLLVSSDRNYLAIVNWYNGIELRNLEDYSIKWKLSKRRQFATAEFTPDGSQIIAAAYNNRSKPRREQFLDLFIIDSETGKLLKVAENKMRFAHSITFDQQKRYISIDDKLLDIETWETKYQVKGHKNLVRGACFSHDDRYYISVSQGREHSFVVLDIERELEHSLSTDASSLFCCASYPSLPYVVIAGAEGFIEVWNVESQSIIMKLKGHTGSIMSVSVSHNGEYILSQCSDGKAILWNANSGETLASVVIVGWANSVAFTQDSKKFLCLGANSAYIFSCEDYSLQRIVHPNNKKMCKGANLTGAVGLSDAFKKWFKEQGGTVE